MKRHYELGKLGREWTERYCMIYHGFIMRFGVLTAGLLWTLASGCTSSDAPAPDGRFDPLDGAGRSVDGPAADAHHGDGPAVSRLALAAHWAPVWYQDTDSSDYKADYIVAYDFDGDTRSDNNWENLKKPGVDLSAVIYYSVVETQTHWFINYSDFHPRDWKEHCYQPIPKLPVLCHENDMEGAMVVIRKDGSPHGSFFLMYTEAHTALYIFTNDIKVKPLKSKRLKTVPVTFENGTHPELFVEAKGHGVCALRYSGSKHCKHSTSGTPPPFPGGDGIVYRYKGGKAEVPASGKDQNVGYRLVPLATTLWARRKDICDGGCTFDRTMTYEGMKLGLAFDGDTHGKDKANPPWAWDDPDDGPVYRGDLFFRPAESLLTHLKVTGAFSKTYLYNPFLQGKP